PAKNTGRTCGKPASCKKHGTNLRGSQLPAKNMGRTCGKPASCKKHGTNLWGSRLPAKNMERTCEEASFLQKTRNELTSKPASRKKHGRNLQKSQLPGKSTGSFVIPVSGNAQLRSSGQPADSYGPEHGFINIAAFSGSYSVQRLLQGQKALLRQRGFTATEN